MRRIRNAALAASLCLAIAGPARAQTPALIWAKALYGGGFTGPYALALRGSKLWAGGNFTTSADLGGATYGSPLNSYLVLYDTDGVYQWSHAFNVGNGAITAIGVDVSDNVYIAGQFDGTVNFGGSPLTTLGGFDIFLAKFNSSGVHQWSKRFGDAGLNDAALALAIDNLGNVIIGGRFSGTTNFGGGGLTTAGGMDAFLAKFDPTGAHQWSQKFGDATDQSIEGLASALGDVYATGTFSGTVNLGGSNLVSAGKSDIMLARFNSSGAHQWSKSFGNSDYQYGVDVDTDGSVVMLLANFAGTAYFGGSVLTSAGGTDIAVARFTAAGAHVWSKSFGDSDAQTGFALDYSGGSVFVSGYFEGTLNFGHTLGAGSSGRDAFLARLSSGDGSEVWSQHFGYNTNDDFGFDVQSNGTQTFFGGRFQRDINLGYNGTLFSPARDYEGFLAKVSLTPQEPAIRSVTDVKRDQGGKVEIRFVRSDYDALTSVLPIRNYEVYLRDDPLNAAAAGARAAPASETWLLAGEAPPHGLGEYYTLAFTQQDSTIATGLHSSVYKVRAVTDDPSVYIESLPLSGYSLDNLAPTIPLNFVIHDGELSWRGGGEGDIAYYTVYGSADAFDESAQVIDYTTTTRMDVTTRAFARYYVTATDRAGNESRPASLEGARAGTASTPRTLSVSAFPNPFNPATTLRYTVPASGHVNIAVYDAHGALVATLFDGERAAGAYSVKWDGHTESAAIAASGIYFARIEHNGATRAYKLVVLK